MPRAEQVASTGPAVPAITNCGSADIERSRLLLNRGWTMIGPRPLAVQHVVSSPPGNHAFMKQVIQNFKTGELWSPTSRRPPRPARPRAEPLFADQRGNGAVDCHHRSGVSPGQSASTAGPGQAGPRHLRRDGIADTLSRVRTKLETLKELGYSSAGRVLASMDTDGRFKPGDRVACGGGNYASHAGIVTVPQNLVVKVPDAVGLTLPRSRLWGRLRCRASGRPTRSSASTCASSASDCSARSRRRSCRANGCQVFGVDTEASVVVACHRTRLSYGAARSDVGLDSAFAAFTGGRGFDAVIITAAAQSADPVELATSVLRQKGLIVIVGAVPMNVPREPHFYKKELELKISCSYGPGRYDPCYEEGGRTTRTATYAGPRTGTWPRS